MSDKFYITLSAQEQEKIQACLQAGRFDNPSDLIRDGIEHNHRRLMESQEQNQKLRAGLTSICERLERYQVS